MRWQAQTDRRYTAMSQQEMALSFRPTVLAGLTGWWRADQGVTIVTGVSQWSDLSGLGHHLLQANTAKQPVFGAASGPGGRPGIAGDGVDDFLQGAWVAPQPVHAFLVCKWTNAFAAADTIIDGGAGNSLRFWRSSAIRLQIDSAGTDLGANGQNTIAFHYYGMQFNGASSAWSTDGTQQAAGPVGAATTAGLTLFTFGDGSSTPTAGIVSEVMTFSRILSAVEEARVNAYLRARYSL